MEKQMAKVDNGVLKVGFSNYVVSSRLVAILVPGSSPMRRLKEEAGKAARLANATHGRKCRSMLLLDSGQIVLSSVQPETLRQRLGTVSSYEEEDSGCRVVSCRVVAVLAAGSAPVQRHKQEAQNAGRLVDTTHGRKCRSILLLDSRHMILSSVHPETMCQRLDAVSQDIPLPLKEVTPFNP